MDGTTSILLRFEHFQEAKEVLDPSPINIKLNEDLFKGFRMTQLTEMALGGDRSISEVWKKFQWTRNKVLLFTMKKYEIPKFFLE